MENSLRRFFKGIFTFIIILLLLAAAVYVYARFIEPALCVTTRHEVKCKTLPPQAEGIRVVQFSDVQLADFYPVERLEKAARAINAEEPNIVVFTGDLFEDYSFYTVDEDRVIAALSSIRAPLGKFAVLGNHDFVMNTQRHAIRVLEAGGFRVLRNDSAALDLVGITITGIDDCMFGQGSAKELQTLSPGTFNLVLCHEPDIFAEAGEANIDLMLAGHTHGGQIKLPVLGAMVLPPMGKRYPEGWYEAGNTRGSRLYVNRGLSMSYPPYRLMSIPEITVFTLRAG